MVGAICTGTRTTPVKFCDDGSGSSTGPPAVVEECDKPVKGSVKLEKYPQGRVIVYNGSKWVTFTRNWFIYKQNDYGAQMICKQLGYTGGNVANSAGVMETDVGYAAGRGKKLQ